MGEQDETVDDDADADGPIEIPDDEDDAGPDEDAPADSPYGGTGLGAVAAANMASGRG